MQLTLTPVLSALLLVSSPLISASLVAALPVDTIRSIVQRDAEAAPGITKRATIFDENCGSKSSYLTSPSPSHPSTNTNNNRVI
jgi:hypothetical protein